MNTLLQGEWVVCGHCHKRLGKWKGLKLQIKNGRSKTMIYEPGHTEIHCDRCGQVNNVKKR